MKWPLKSIDESGKRRVGPQTTRPQNELKAKEEPRPEQTPNINPTSYHKLTVNIELYLKRETKRYIAKAKNFDPPGNQKSRKVRLFAN